MQQFDEVFALQENEDLAGSFEFLKGCLQPHADQYFALPGSGDSVTVSVAADPPTPDGKFTLKAIWLGSIDILRRVPDNEVVLSWSQRTEFDFPELREFLSKAMVVPKRLLNIELQFPYTSGTRLILPSSLMVGRMR